MEAVSMSVTEAKSRCFVDKRQGRCDRHARIQKAWQLHLLLLLFNISEDNSNTNVVQIHIYVRVCDWKVKARCFVDESQYRCDRHAQMQKGLAAACVYVRDRKAKACRFVDERRDVQM